MMNIAFFGGEIMNKVREIDVTKEDKRNNEEDRYTGWWYVNID